MGRRGHFVVGRGDRPPAGTDARGQGARGALTPRWIGDREGGSEAIAAFARARIAAQAGAYRAAPRRRAPAASCPGGRRRRADGRSGKYAGRDGGPGSMNAPVGQTGAPAPFGW
ncbi:hypothetical protein [Streptomyces sp. AHA2]|uniref:hypothetical protein n=1 Tax=Streptomyces sp. AHA2 TaxID=3064526 RepID=UPI003FA746B0